ncbi:unnamed protein product [Closterium sp. NIES-53]
MTVYHLKSVFNWDYRQAGNFYHFIIEAVPLLYAAARLLPSLLLDIPIAAKSDQFSLLAALCRRPPAAPSAAWHPHCRQERPGTRLILSPDCSAVRPAVPHRCPPPPALAAA